MASCGSMTFTKQKRKKISAEANMTNSFLTELSGTIVSRLLLLLAVLCVHYESVGGVLVQTPSNKTVIANHSTSFNCSTNNSNSDALKFTWYHYPVGDKIAIEVYENGQIKDEYKGRFDVEPDSTSGAFNLLVQRPNREDAGTYNCTDDQYVLPGASANLIILDSNPFCESNKSLQEVVGYTQCIKAIDPDKMMFSCRVNYSGNTAPQMTWIQSDTASELKTTCYEDRDKVVICNTMLDGNLVREGSVFVCQIKTAEQYGCSLKVNRTIYAFASTTKTEYRIEDEVTCVANVSSQLSCSYKWINYNSTEVSSNQTFKPTDPGSYRCLVQCQIRNNSICGFTAMDINVTSVPDQGKSATVSGSNLQALWCLLPIGIAIIIGIILAIRYKDRWLRRCRKNDPPSPDEIEMDTSNEITARNPLLEDTREAPSSRILVQDVSSGCQENNIQPSGENEEPSREALQSQQANGRTGEQIQPPIISNDTHENDDSQDVTDAILSIESFVQKACHDDYFIGKEGLNGKLYRRRVYKGKQCAFEKITCPFEGEVTEIDQICINGEAWKALDDENVIKCENVIKFYDVVKLPQAVVLVMEYAAGGTVRDALNKFTENLPHDVVINWAKQIAQGMKYLHKKDIIHGDLQCARISIMETVSLETSARAKLKINCHRLACKKNTVSSKTHDEFAWVAPEAFKQTNKSKCCDVWSYGVTVWEILTRGIPYKDKNAGEIVTDILHGNFSLPTSDFESCPDFKNLFEGCFDRDPARRPTFDDILTSLRGSTV